MKIPPVSPGISWKRGAKWAVAAAVILAVSAPVLILGTRRSARGIRPPRGQPPLPCMSDISGHLGTSW